MLLRYDPLGHCKFQLKAWHCNGGHRACLHSLQKGSSSCPSYRTSSSQILNQPNRFIYPFWNTTIRWIGWSFFSIAWRRIWDVTAAFCGLTDWSINTLLPNSYRWSCDLCSYRELSCVWWFWRPLWTKSVMSTMAWCLKILIWLARAFVLKV